MQDEEEDLSRLKQLIRDRAVKVRESGFVLASGRRSNLYVDLRKVTQDPAGINLIGRLVLSRIREVSPESEYVGGLETASIPIATAVSLLSASSSKPLSAFWVRKKPKDHGLENRIEGNLLKGASVVIVDDTVTTGVSSLQAVEAVREAGAKISYAIAVVDRGAETNFKNAGIPFTYLFSEADIAK